MLPVWRIVVLRLPGFIGAAFFLTAALLGNALASDEGDLLSPSELTLWRLGALVFALPLLLPWRFLARPVAWRVLIGWLCLDAIILTSREVYQVVWFFGHRPFDIWVAYILPTTLFLVAGVWMAVAAALIARKYLGCAPTQVRTAA
jgi:hypothetical protein